MSYTAGENPVSNQHNLNQLQMVELDAFDAAPAVWWLVLRQELVDLWVGGRVFILLILFSALMSITTLLRQAESQMSLIPPTEMVYLTLLGSISFGLFIGLILGADSISGERERATLESLLLTPTSRRQIVLGKFLAAMSPWPVALILSIPYMAVLAQGDKVFGQAIVAGALLGSILAVAFTGFGILVSIWAKSNKVSLFVTLLVYVIFLIPTQFPGSAQKGDLGYFVQQLNPLQATSEFLEKLLVNNRTVGERVGYLFAAILAATVILALIFLYAAPRLTLEGGAPRLARPTWRRAASLSVSACLLVGLLLSLATVTQAAPVTVAEQALQITVDLAYQTVTAGDEIEFNTVVTNSGAETSPTLHVAMNIVKTGKGDPVDPEDWSPQRTQEIASLGPGESVDLPWTVEAILEGDYMVYLTVIPQPDGPESTSQPISSAGIHLTVLPFTNTNPGGVLPIAIGMPVALILISLLPRRSKRWRKAGRAGDSEPGAAKPAPAGG